MIIQAVNSYVGKQGNIGLRTSYILNEMKHYGLDYQVIARGATTDYKKGIYSMGVLGHFPRALNAFRIYCNPRFNHRLYDIRMFDFFSSLFFRLAVSTKNDNDKILHVWELSPVLLSLAKSKGYKLLLDIPIAPHLYALELHKNGLMVFENYDFDAMIEIEKKCYEMADSLVVPSPFVRDVVMKYGIGPEKIQIVPFGCDVREPREISGMHKSGGVRFCFAGTINVRKGISFLLDAWDDAAFFSDELHLCGRLFPEQGCEIKARELKNVVIPGFVDTKEYFRSCDVYVFPSLMEGSSKSVYEAMASGMPVITTYNAGSIVRDGVDGFIVPIGDASALKEKMAFFKDNPDKIVEMGRNAYNRVREYPWQKYARNIIGLYRSGVVHEKDRY